MTTPEIPIGARVSVTAGSGYVRWTGVNPKFSAGKWVGVELDGPTGKNNGSVQGERYFECAGNHGVFVRPSQVKVLEAPPPTPKASSSRPSSTRPPPTPTMSRLASSQSTRSSTPPKPPAASRSSPASPPRAGSRSSATVPTSGTTAAPQISRSTSTRSVARPPSAAASATLSDKEQATTRAVSPTQRPVSVISVGSGKRVSSPPNTEPNTTSFSSMGPPPVPVSALTAAVAKPTSPDPNPPKPTLNSPTRTVSSPMRTKSTVTPSAPSTAEAPTSPFAKTRSLDLLGGSLENESSQSSIVFAQKRELEELRIKVRLLESRKIEDQEKIRALESKVGETDILRAARVKLQAKLQEIQASFVAAQRLSRDLQSENALLETRVSEATDQLEMATLDREVAEERAEAAEQESTLLNEKIAELEMEVAVLKEENAEYEKPIGEGVGERTSLAFVQLEKHNERLKEALIRLRDMSAEAEKEHKAKIGDLERELVSQDDLQNQLEFTQAKLRNAEAQVEDLKAQLDDALGAEEMLIQLTERNLQMGERIEEMRITIEDLEALKELNDELEENHVETENQLNEEIESLSLQLQDDRQRSADLENAVLDMEGTITQFRELVSNLQNEIDSLRMQQATQESESASASKESQALMNLNFKLQSSAAKSQSKTIDLELKKLEAAQLAEHLRIVKAYLPDEYLTTDADSVNALLFFHRISSKIDILLTVISQLHNIPSALHSASGETLVGVCELRGKLRHFATLNSRFAGVLVRTDPAAYLSLGKVITEVGGIEARVDGWIAQIKADEFNEGECARDLSSLIAQFDHLAEHMFNRPDADVPERQLGLAYSVDYDLDNFAAAVSFARQSVLALASEEDMNIDVGESSLEEGVYDPVQRILDQVRSVKVPSGKLVAEMAQITRASTALSPELMALLFDLVTSVSNAVDLAVQLAQRIGAHTTSIRASKAPLRLSDIEGFLYEVATQSSASSETPPWEIIGMFVNRLGVELTGTLSKIRSAIKTNQLVSMNIPPPWLARVKIIKEAASHNAEAEMKIMRLSEDLKDMLREVKIRDQSLQEAGIKVETLERRLEATRKQADIILELENDVAKAKKQEKVYEDAIEQLQAEQDTLEAENAKLRREGGGSSGIINNGGPGSTGQSTTGGGPGGSGSVGVGLGIGVDGRALGTFNGGDLLVVGAGGIEVAHLVEQVENLRSAIRFLRFENAFLKSRHLYNDLYSLPPLLEIPTTITSEPPVPPLEASSSTDEDEDEIDEDLCALITPTKIMTDNTKRVLEMESKMLFRAVAAYQTRSKIVDISRAGPRVEAEKGMGSSNNENGMSGTVNGKVWRSRKDSPHAQIWRWEKERKELEKRVELLARKARVR